MSIRVGAAVPTRLEEHEQGPCSESGLIYKHLVNFSMLYSEAETPIITSMNGKVTAYGKSDES